LFHEIESFVTPVPARAVEFVLMIGKIGLFGADI